jgi:hypothetical protein
MFMNVIDKIFTMAFASANTAIFDVGSLMAVLMLLFGVLDYKYGERLRRFISTRHLDKPLIMTGLALIPVDGTLLFQFSAYRRRSIRFGSLLGGMIGIGEEATYLIMTYQPLTWLILAGIKLLTAAVFGGLFNSIPKLVEKSEKWAKDDAAASVDKDAALADVNFHELPDKFRHRLHHFRYHQLGRAFWIFFAAAFVLHAVFSLFEQLKIIGTAQLVALNIPFADWLAMLALFSVAVYKLVVSFTTREFGKIFENEFEDTGDAVGDLAETCASVILLIFIVSFAVETVVQLIGLDRLSNLFAGSGLLAVLVGALVGLIPGTGASLAFTALYFALPSSGNGIPFAALVACSIALIGDSQFIGSRLIKKSQRVAHMITFVLALLIGSLVYFVERLI